jgi:hypothetical protein
MRVYTKTEVMVMEPKDRGVLYRQLREARKLTTKEVTRLIQAASNNQVGVWESYGTIPNGQLTDGRERLNVYYELLGIDITQ